jgi:hypothetical protein
VVAAYTSATAFVAAAKTTMAMSVGMAAMTTTTALCGDIDRGLGSPAMHHLALLGA